MIYKEQIDYLRKSLSSISPMLLNSTAILFRKNADGTPQVSTAATLKNQLLLSPQKKQEKGKEKSSIKY